MAATTASTSFGPGLSLYGGVPRREAEGNIRQVARVEAQIVQRRTIREGESCGYGATFVAEADTEAAILNIGYADGYLRGFSSRGIGVRRRICAAGARPRVDGPDRRRLRRSAGAQGRRLGRARLRPADGVEAVRPFAVRASDDARLRFERRWA